jgi:protein SCO1/2
MKTERPHVPSSRLPAILIVLAGLAVGAAAALAVFPEARGRLLPAAGVKVMGQALVGGPFTLTDHTGKRVSDQHFRGRFMLVFFGFTFCPDVCPTALQVASEALSMLGPKAERIAPIFISIDPERDTPSQLASYVGSFHPRLVGLTGSQAEIDAVVKAYRVYVRRVDDPKSSAGYTFDHTSLIYVMGPDGAYRAHFTHATNAEAMAKRLAGLL